MKARALVVALVLLAGCNGGDGEPTGANGATGPAQPEPLRPQVMAALGDSITQATNVDPALPLGANPDQSWATGTAVLSHALRLGIGPEAAHNLAVPGAAMADAPAQAEQAVATGAGYVTFLMGANDVCAATPVEGFRADLDAALDRLSQGLPDAHLFVVSIPDVVHLATVYAEDPTAQQTWQAVRLCPAVLGTGADRAAAQERIESYNEALEESCRARSRCRTDDGAVHRYRFEAEHVSRLDYFHPSIAGQTELAGVTWEAGWWGGED